MADVLRILLMLLVIWNIPIEADKIAVLEVKNGATLYLRKPNLNIVGSQGEACKVQVVENEPMYQSVGELTPKVSIIRTFISKRTSWEYYTFQFHNALGGISFRRPETTAKLYAVAAQEI